MSLTVSKLNKRSLDVFREIIETFIETGEPVGSRTLSRRLEQPLSPATIRNVMADLEDAGLLYAPHTSAGRLPTDMGLNFFVNGLLEIGDLGDLERDEIESKCRAQGLSVDQVLEEASKLLSRLSCCAGLVMAPKMDAPLKHIEFVLLAPERVLVILIAMDGTVENRILEIPQTISQVILNDAASYLSSRIYNKTLEEAKVIIEKELQEHQTQLNELTSKVVEMGLGIWSGEKDHNGGSLIIKGQSNLLDSVTEVQDLEQIKSLFQILDTKDQLLTLLNASIKADGVQIFIGSENSLFQLSGCSMVISPYRNAQQKIIGAIGVIGSSRMNYSRIIPLVDYTAKIVGKLIG